MSTISASQPHASMSSFPSIISTDSTLQIASPVPTSVTPANNVASPDATHIPTISDPEASSNFATLGPSEAHHEPASNAESPLPSSIGGVQIRKHQRERERRIMPARLRRVSNLLAGSTIEDELSGTNPKMEAYNLPPTMLVAFSSLEKLGFDVRATTFTDVEGDYFYKEDRKQAVRATQMIETPDFKTRDDTEMMGKTRSIRSEEDTSDAAYERRHRKPDNMEKKQRRLEKERLVRDRQKLKERIDQLRVADSRLLMPILTAREQHQRQTERDTPVNTETASPRGAEATYGLGKQNMSADAAQTLSKLELLRTELLEEAHDTLKRYDALLTVPTEITLPNPAKRKAGENGVEEERVTSKSGRSISLSGAFANKRGTATATAKKPTSTNSSSGATSKAKARRKSLTNAKSGSPSGTNSKRLSLGSEQGKSPQPFKPEDGPVRAENTYANIHARTSGGRFAPKSALSGEKGSTSKINTKGKWKAEGQPNPKKRNRPASKTTSARARTKEMVTSTTKMVNSLIESVATTGGENKLRRVKLILNKRGKGDGGAGSSSGTSSSSVNTPVVSKEEVEVEVDTTPQRAARAALTLEEAQALLAKAMEDDDDDEEIEWEVKREFPSNN